MKQFINKYKWLALVLLVLPGCQRDDGLPFEEPVTERRVVVQAADVPEVVEQLNQSLRFKQDGRLFGINDGNGALNLQIDWEQIYQLIDEQGKETYTFRIADEDGDFATFYNLVMKFSENGEPYKPFLMKYTMDEDYAREFLETGSSQNFRGKVQRILLSKSSSTAASRANLEDPFGDSGVDTNPCPDETVIGGGNTGGSDPVDVGDNCQMMLVTTTWYSQVCDPTGCGAPSITDITQSLEFVCDSDGATAAWSETECDPVDEEIPILEPEGLPSPFICNKHIDFKTVGSAQTAQISGLGMSLHHPSTFRLKFIELGIVCVTLPAPNSTAATAMFNTSYNAAVIEFTAKLNANAYGPNPLTSTLKDKFRDIIREELRAFAGSGASVVRFTTGACIGGITNTPAKYCKKD